MDSAPTASSREERVRLRRTALIEFEIDRALQEGRFAYMDPRSTMLLTTLGVILGVATLGLIVVNP